MKTYGGVEKQLRTFLTSALNAGDWSATRPGRFTAGERTAGIHWLGSRIGRRTGLDAEVKRKNLPLPGIESRSSSQ